MHKLHSDYKNNQTVKGLILCSGDDTLNIRRDIKMYEEQDLDEIIRMLDAKVDAYISRITVKVEEAEAKQKKKEEYHHGRCDIGSPWADGTVGNCD